MGRHTSVSSAEHGGLFVRHGMAFTAQQNDGLPLEGFEWMQAGRTFLGIYSLFLSCLLSHLLITAGWCGLSPAYLIHHIFMFGKRFREVRTFDPDIPSPAFPSISLPLPFSDRERHLARYVSNTSSLPSPGRSHYSSESTSLATAALNTRPR